MRFTNVWIIGKLTEIRKNYRKAAAKSVANLPTAPGHLAQVRVWMSKNTIHFVIHLPHLLPSNFIVKRNISILFGRQLLGTKSKRNPITLIQPNNETDPFILL